MFKTYQLYYTTGYGVKGTQGKQGCENKFLDNDFRPARGIIFKGRNEKEAMKKAHKFWQDGQFGSGRFFVKELVF